jgi:hypothetical protein
MCNLNEIMKGLSRFIDMWEPSVREDITKGYQSKHGYLIHYWKGVKAALEEDCDVVELLKSKFWTLTLEGQFDPKWVDSIF